MWGYKYFYWNCSSTWIRNDTFGKHTVHCIFGLVLLSNNALPIDFFSFNKYHLTPLPCIFLQKLIWSPPACFWRKGLRSPQQRKWKSFQKHFSWPTRPWTKPAVNWSRFHFLITFSWGTMARPLPNPGHSRPLAFFPRQLAPPPRTRGL